MVIKANKQKQKGKDISNKTIGELPLLIMSLNYFEVCINETAN